MAREHVISTLTTSGVVVVLGTAGVVMGLGSRGPEAVPLQPSDSRPAFNAQPDSNQPGVPPAVAGVGQATHPGGQESPALAQQPTVIGDAGSRGTVPPKAVPASPSSAAVRASYQARLASDGLLPGQFHFRETRSGRIISAERITITFLRQGRVVSRVEPGTGGVFQAAGLEPGAYSVVASGPDGFAAFGLQVLPASKSAVADESLQVQARLLPPSTWAVLEQLVPRYLGEADGNTAVGSGIANGVSRTSEAVPVAVASASRNGSNGGTVRGLVLPIRDDGLVSGRLVRAGRSAGQAIPAGDLTVFLVQGDRILARTRAETNGRFYFTAVEPGHYSLLALGPTGLAAVGVRTVPGENFAANSKRASGHGERSRLHHVGYQQEGEGETPAPNGPPTELGIAVVQQQDLPPALDEVPPGEDGEDDDAGDDGDEPLPPAGGGPAGGGGGGALLAAMSGTALGLGIAALDDDDDDEERPVSPFRPDGDD